jgi:hypothetical protein
MSISETRRNNYRALVERIRNKYPGDHGLREFRVFIKSASWSGAYPGRGTETDSETELLEGEYGPKLRFLSNEELAVGQLENRSVEIGPITPEHTTGGTALTTIQPILDAGDTLHLRITGPGFSTAGDIYAVTRMDTDRALRFMIQAKPVQRGT